VEGVSFARGHGPVRARGSSGPSMRRPGRGHQEVLEVVGLPPPHGEAVNIAPSPRASAHQQVLCAPKTCSPRWGRGCNGRDTSRFWHLQWRNPPHCLPKPYLPSALSVLSSLCGPRLACDRVVVALAAARPCFYLSACCTVSVLLMCCSRAWEHQPGHDPPVRGFFNTVGRGPGYVSKIRLDLFTFRRGEQKIGSLCMAEATVESMYGPATRSRPHQC
jgi:hypothetical protein